MRKCPHIRTKKMIMSVLLSSILIGIFLITACPVPENEILKVPVDRVQLTKNQTALNPQEEFEILEGQSVILGARLFPQGVTGGIHWQSSRRGILGQNSFFGPEIVVTGLNGGRTIVSVFARNGLNEVYAQAECTVTVIPSSFFKWNYIEEGWLDLPAHENVIVGKINEMPVRSGQTPITADAVRGGFVLEGPGMFIIGSGMTTATNSAFSSDPAYDERGEFNFLEGPSFDYLEYVYDEDEWKQELKQKRYPFWDNRIKISVEYEKLDISAGKSLLRIQVNNNTLERNNASAIDNWLVTELGPASAQSGVLTGIFNSSVSKFDPLLSTAKIVKIIEDIKEESPIAYYTKLETVLRHSFVCLALPDGQILIRNIRIDSAQGQGAD